MISFLKKNLKKIFPDFFLKKAFLYYNILRIKTIDKIIFPELMRDENDFVLYRTGYPFKENKVEVESIKNPYVREKMREWYNWTQEEFILRVSALTIIEPLYGWGIEGKNKLNYFSLGISRTLHQKKPSLINLIFHTRKQTLPRCVSFRDTGEENYFHFFNDVLAKLYFLRKNNLIDLSVPLIISSKLYKRDYFQYFLEKTSIKNYNWHIQNEKTYIHASDAIFCKPITHRADIFNEILDELKIPEENLVQNKKIYLTRRKESLRFISNEKDLLPFLKEKKYEVIDSSELRFSEQMQLFSEVSHLIGVHGAGLTNMIFRRGGKMSVVELLSPYQKYLPFHYIMLSQMFNFNYKAIVGKESKAVTRGGFQIEKSDLLSDIS